MGANQGTDASSRADLRRVARAKGKATNTVKKNIFETHPVSLLEEYGDHINYQKILGNIPLEERQKDISEEIADNIKYLRRRVEAKHRFLEAEERERERV